MCGRVQTRIFPHREFATTPPGRFWVFIQVASRTSFVTGFGTCLYRIDDGTIKIRGDMLCLLSRLKCVWRPVPFCVEVRT